MTEVFGWVAAVIGIGSIVPQLARLLRTRDSAGVSMRLWQLTAGTGAAWGVHGLLIGSAQLQVPNFVGAALSATIVILVLRWRRAPVLRELCLAAALCLALSLIDVAFGAVVFGLVIAVPQLVGQSAQLRDLLTTRDPAGVSAAFLATFVLGQGLWFTYGLGHGDWALIICAGIMIVIASLNLGICLVRQARVARLRPRTGETIRTA